jgi:hypothetical protein
MDDNSNKGGYSDQALTHFMAQGSLFSSYGYYVEAASCSSKLAKPG